MRCPHYQTHAALDSIPHCMAATPPGAPSLDEQAAFCTSGRHRLCPVYRQANRDLLLAIDREVARAIG